MSAARRGARWWRRRVRTRAESEPSACGVRGHREAQADKARRPTLPRPRRAFARCSPPVRANTNGMDPHLERRLVPRRRHTLGLSASEARGASAREKARPPIAPHAADPTGGQGRAGQEAEGTSWIAGSDVDPACPRPDVCTGAHLGLTRWSLNKAPRMMRQAGHAPQHRHEGPGDQSSRPRTSRQRQDDARATNAAYMNGELGTMRMKRERARSAPGFVGPCWAFRSGGKGRGGCPICLSGGARSVQGDAGRAYAGGERADRGCGVAAHVVVIARAAPGEAGGGVDGAAGARGCCAGGVRAAWAEGGAEGEPGQQGERGAAGGGAAVA